MDFFAIAGILLGFAAILGGQMWEGGAIEALINGPAFLIVVGGTFAATLLQTPWSVFLTALRQLRWILVPPKLPFADGLRRMTSWAATARKEGLLGLEQIVERDDDPFTRKGMALLIDGGEPLSIRSAMVTEMELEENRQIEAAKVFESMGGYAPTLGILGAVLGLIQVMGNLSDPSLLGAGIAVAFVATVYGVGLANLVLIPIAGKMRALALRQSQYREMLIEGIVAIAEGENPRVIEARLSGYLKSE
jgi:chemotaxis protein MotA